MKLQYAKESLLERLQREREESKSAEATTLKQKSEQTSTVPEVVATAKGVPGTPVPGKKDWVVGKYGRALPVMKLKKSYKIPMVKHDPSKYCHTAKVFKDETSGVSDERPCDKLTWEIDQPDSEMTKKRKGEFPDTPPPSKKKSTKSNINGTVASRKGVSPSHSDYKSPYSNSLPSSGMDSPFSELEIVRIGGGPFMPKKSHSTVTSVHNKFDSDVESESESNLSALNGKKKKRDREPSLKQINHSKPANVVPVPNNSPASLSKASNGFGCPGGISEFRGLSMLSDYDLSEPSRSSSQGEIDAESGSGKNKENRNTEGNLEKTMSDSKNVPARSKTESPYVPLSPKKVKKENLSKSIDVPASSKRSSTLRTESESSNVPSTPKKMKNGACTQENGSAESFQLTNSGTSISKMKTSTPSSTGSTTRAYGPTDYAGQFKIVPEFKGLSMLVDYTLQEPSLKHKAQAAADETETTKFLANSKPDKTPSIPVTSIDSMKDVAAEDKSPDLVAEQSSKLSKKQKIDVSSKNSANAEALKEKFAALSAEFEGSDSCSSGGTDKIILSHKAKQGFNPAFNSSNSKQPNQQKSPAKSLSQVKVTASDNNLYLSEFVSDMTEDSSGFANNKLSPYQNSADNDSYDSDLDSNDFALVARKLSQLAQGKGKTKNKSLNTKDASIRETPAVPSSDSERAKDCGKQVLSNLQSRLVGMADVEEKKDNTVSSKSSDPGDKRPADEKRKKLTEEEKHKAANEKRLEAVREQTRIWQKQHQHMQQALKNVDSCKDNTKRIVFESSSDESDDGEESQVNVSSSKSATEVTFKNTSKEKPGKNLFEASSEDESDDDDDDYDEMFKSKPQFEGKKGEKLLKLQKSFGGDQRFKLDAKFADTSSEEDEEEEEDEEVAENVSTETPDLQKSLKDEKSASLKVLEGIVGKNTLDRFSEKINRNTKKIIDMNTVRFDPTKTPLSTKPLGKEDDLKAVADTPTKQKKKSRKSETELFTQPGSDYTSKTQVEATGQSESALKGGSKVSSDSSNQEKKETVDEYRESDKKEAKVSAVNKAVTTTIGKSSHAEVSTSLVDLFKTKSTDANKDGNETSTSFSLLQHFGDVDSDDLDDDMNGAASNGQTIFSYINKKQAEVITSQGQQRMELDVSSDGDEPATKKEKNDVKINPDSSFFKTDVSSEDEEEDDNEMESDPINCSVSKTVPDEEGIDAEMINAGRVDVRFTKEEWHEKWDALRQSIIKIYKKKHRDALKKKRIQGETKRKKEFLKNSKRPGKKQWGVPKKR